MPTRNNLISLFCLAVVSFGSASASAYTRWLDEATVDTKKYFGTIDRTKVEALCEFEYRKDGRLHYHAELNVIKYGASGTGSGTLFCGLFDDKGKRLFDFGRSLTAGADFFKGVNKKSHIITGAVPANNNYYMVGGMRGSSTNIIDDFSRWTSETLGKIAKEGVEEAVKRIPELAYIVLLAAQSETSPVAQRKIDHKDDLSNLNLGGEEPLPGIQYRAVFKNTMEIPCSISVESAGSGITNFVLEPNESHVLSQVVESDRYCWTWDGAAGPCEQEVADEDSFGCWKVPPVTHGIAGCAYKDVSYHEHERCFSPSSD